LTVDLRRSVSVDLRACSAVHVFGEAGQTSAEHEPARVLRVRERSVGGEIEHGVLLTGGGSGRGG
jgi:hypothetical protein